MTLQRVALGATVAALTTGLLIVSAPLASARPAPQGPTPTCSYTYYERDGAGKYRGAGVSCSSGRYHIHIRCIVPSTGETFYKDGSTVSAPTQSIANCNNKISAARVYTVGVQFV